VQSCSCPTLHYLLSAICLCLVTIRCVGCLGHLIAVSRYDLKTRQLLMEVTNQVFTERVIIPQVMTRTKCALSSRVQISKAAVTTNVLKTPTSPHPPRQKAPGSRLPSLPPIGLPHRLASRCRKRVGVQPILRRHACCDFGNRNTRGSAARFPEAGVVVILAGWPLRI
jgi:hypothetical protein